MQGKFPNTIESPQDYGADLLDLVKHIDPLPVEFNHNVYAEVQNDAQSLFMHIEDMTSGVAEEDKNLAKFQIVTSVINQVYKSSLCDSRTANSTIELKPLEKISPVLPKIIKSIINRFGVAKTKHGIVDPINGSFLDNLLTYALKLAIELFGNVEAAIQDCDLTDAQIQQIQNFIAQDHQSGFCPGDSGTRHMDEELRHYILIDQNVWSQAYPLPSREAMTLLAQQNPQLNRHQLAELYLQSIDALIQPQGYVLAQDQYRVVMQNTLVGYTFPDANERQDLAGMFGYYGRIDVPRQKMVKIIRNALGSFGSMNMHWLQNHKTCGHFSGTVSGTLAQCVTHRPHSACTSKIPLTDEDIILGYGFQTSRWTERNKATMTFQLTSQGIMK